MKFEDLEPGEFPHKRELRDGRFGYIMPLTFGRGRINVTTLEDPFSVRDFY